MTTYFVIQVPVHLTVYGLSASLASILTGRLSQYFSKLYFVCFAAIVDGVAYLYYLFWIPDASTQWAVIPVYIFAGGMQGVLGPILSGMLLFIERRNGVFDESLTIPHREVRLSGMFVVYRFRKRRPKVINTIQF